MPIFNNVLAGAAGSAGGAGDALEEDSYQIENSLLFDGNGYLHRNLSSATNQRQMTWSFWIKLNEPDPSQTFMIFGQDYNTSGDAVVQRSLSLQINSSGKFQVFDYGASSAAGNSGNNQSWTPNQLNEGQQLSDPSAWYHIIVAIDTTQSTEANRVKVWLNGVQGSLDSYPTQNSYLSWGQARKQYIGRQKVNGSWTRQAKCQLAEVHFIDGQQLSDSDFGEFDDKGRWVAKDCKDNLTYGTTGFYLNFSNTSNAAALGTDSSGSSNTWSVEGMYASTTAGGAPTVTGSNIFPAEGTAIANLWDGQTSSYPGDFLTAANGGIITINWPTPITGVTKIQYYSYNGNDRHDINNGGMSSNSGSGGGWKTAYDSSTPIALTSLALQKADGNSYVKIGGIKVNDVHLTTSNYNSDKVYANPCIDSPSDYESASGNNRGNYCTFNPLSNGAGTLSNGNLQLGGIGGSGLGRCNGTIGVSSGKWYYEVTLSTPAHYTSAGIGQGFITNQYPGQDTLSYAYTCEQGKTIHNNSQPSYGSALTTAGDILQVAFDLDNNKLFFGKNGTWMASSNPATGANPAFTITAGTYTPIVRPYDATGVVNVNFGQRGFTYTVPSGFKSLCTMNLPAPPIKEPNKHFDIQTYEGTGSSQTLGGLNFNADIFWRKCRDVNQYHNLVDSVRGLSKSIITNGTFVESGSQSNVSNVTNTGYSIGTEGAINTDERDYVAWLWDAGESNTNVAAGSLNSTVYNTSSTWRNNWTASGNGFGSHPVSKIFDANLGNFMNNAAGGQYITWNTTSYTLSGELLIDTSSSSGVYDIYVNGSKAADTTGTRQWVNCGTFADINEIQFAGTSYGTSDNLGSAGINVYGIKVGGKQLIDSDVTPPNFPSLASTHRTNTTAGCSIITFSAPVGAGNTVAHGLNKKPSFFFYKNLDYAQNWGCYHESLGADYGFNFNTADGKYDDAGYFNDTEPTSSVITFGTYPGYFAGSGTHDHVIYAFSTVEGYSAVGKYTGNGAEDGPFIYTGFRPRWVLIKSHYASNSNAHNHWSIYDTERNVGNEASKIMLASAQEIELDSSHTGIDIMSNGFKMRGDTGGYANYNTNQFVYFAIAENPFKYARAR